MERVKSRLSLRVVVVTLLAAGGLYQGLAKPLREIRAGHTESATIIDCLGRQFRSGMRYTPVAESKSGQHAIGRVFYSRESCTSSIGSTVTILVGAQGEVDGSIISLKQFWFVPALALAGTAVLVAGVIMSRSRRVATS